MSNRSDLTCCAPSSRSLEGVDGMSGVSQLANHGLLVGRHPGSPETILDLQHQGKDPNEGWLGGASALSAALVYRRPVDVIDKFVSRGALVNLGDFSYAVSYRRIDVLRVLIEKGAFSNALSHEILWKEVWQCGDEEIMAVMETDIANICAVR